MGSPSNRPGTAGKMSSARSSAVVLPRRTLASNGSRVAVTSGRPASRTMRRGGGGQFDAGPADFVGAAVDGQLHRKSALSSG